MTVLYCRRLRPALVDLATGTLDAVEARRIESHVESCASCREDLAAMRGVTSALRDPSLPEPPERFWRDQRQAIMRNVRGAVVRPAPHRWRAIGALATAALALVVMRTVLIPVTPHVPHAIEHLDDDALDHLHDLMPAIAPASTVDDADSDILSLHDLGDEELDSLADLLDNPS